MRCCNATFARAICHTCSASLRRVDIQAGAACSGFSYKKRYPFCLITGCLLSEGVSSISWNCLYHHLEYCIPITVSSTLNWARMPAAERLDDPLPIFAFSSTVTRKQRSANRIAVKQLDEPPPLRTT